MKLYTVNQEAKREDCPFGAYRLRLLIAQGKCPGVRIGNRFMIDHDALVEQVRTESLRNVAKAAENAGPRY